MWGRNGTQKWFWLKAYGCGLLVAAGGKRRSSPRPDILHRS